MPYRRRRKRTYKRRPFYRRKRRRRTYVPRRRLTAKYVPSGMANQKIAKLRWNRVFTFASTSGALNTSVIRANSAYQPVAGSSGQPMGWDQWTALFNHYVVLGSKLTLTMVPDSNTTANANCRFGIAKNADITLPYITSQDIMASRNGPYRQVMQNASRPMTMRSTYSTKHAFNITDVKDNLDRLGAAVTADPAEMYYWILWMQADGTNTFSGTFTLQVDYIVAFSEPDDLPVSVS